VAILDYRLVAWEGRRPWLNATKVFAALSLLFGTLIILVTPPLRGPDETAHFLRAFGVAQGDFIAAVRDAQGRGGVLLLGRIYEGFEFFENVRTMEKRAEWSGYGPVFNNYFSRAPGTSDPEARPVFVPYGGSEGYSPVAYLPQAAAALVARFLHLDFLTTFYLMRFAGLAVLTALIVYSIAISPQLGWALAAIAMLPASVYGRSVISADGSALAAAIVVTAVALRRITSPQRGMPWQLSAWMTLSALTKPTHLAFVLLGLMISLSRTSGRLGATTVAILPAILVALLWTYLSGADTAAWRMVEITGQAPVSFDPIVKLAYWLDHPLHFPAAAVGGFSENFVEIWRQMIGVLGLFDTVLPTWVYLTLTVFLAGSLFTPQPITVTGRAWIAFVAAITAAAYVFAIYLVCYLVFTPQDADIVWGVQGRYFVPVLPLLAVIIACIGRRAPDERIGASLAISAAVLSGSASIVAILAADWKI
jgi:uncharacterized membrane protein